MIKVSSNSIGKLQKCARAYKYSYIDNLEPVHRLSFFGFGSAMHAAIEAYRRGARTIAELRSAMMPYAEELNSDDLCKLTAMVEAYWKRYAKDREVFAHVEQEFGYARDEAEVIGVIDAIDMGGRIWESKTTSSIDGAYIEALPHARQTLMYAAFLLSMGEEITGVVYDIIQKPRVKRALATPEEKRKYVKDKKTGQMRLSARQRERDETDAEYLNKLRAWYDKHPEAFHREEISYTAQQLKDIKQEVFDEVDRIRWHMQTGKWPRSRSSCYGRTGKCEFLALCNSGDNPIVKDAHYQEKEFRR